MAQARSGPLPTSGGAVRLEIDGEPLEQVRLWHAAADSVDLSVAGIRRRFAVQRVGDISYADGPHSSAALVAVPRLPAAQTLLTAGSLLAPLPGSVVRVLAVAGESVRAGQPLVVLEAMKMEHTIACPADGVLEAMLVVVGQQADPGQVPAVVEKQETQ